MAPNTENLKEDIKSVGKRSKQDESIQEEKKTNEPPMEQSITQESFLGYFNLGRQGTKHQIAKKKTRRRSGRLSNPNYDIYKTICVQKSSPPDDKKKLQCPSCDSKYSRKLDLSSHIKKTHREKDSISKSSIEMKAAIVKADEKTCIPCGKTYFGKNAKWHLKRHEQSLVHAKTLNYGGNNDKSSFKLRDKLEKAEKAKKLDLSDTEEDFHGFTDVEPHIKLKVSNYIF
jgi:uncharacterized C2H2 Zn-finger protein